MFTERANGLVRRDGGEPFARGLALGSQTVDQTPCRTLRSQPLMWTVKRAVDVVLVRIPRLG